jgi:hypothetical protein
MLHYDMRFNLVLLLLLLLLLLQCLHLQLPGR